MSEQRVQLSKFDMASIVGRGTYITVMLRHSSRMSENMPNKSQTIDYTKGFVFGVYGCDRIWNKIVGEKVRNEVHHAEFKDDG